MAEVVSRPDWAVGNNEFYKHLLDNLYDGVYFVDRDRRITYWNRAAEELTGFSADEVVGRCCFDNLLNHTDHCGEQLCHGRCPLHFTIEDGVSREADVFLCHKQGHRVSVSVRAAPIYDDQGCIVGAIEIFSDNTAKLNAQESSARLAQALGKLDSANLQLRKELGDRQRAEEALMRAEKLASAGRMAATIAHEINNPIAAVMNILYILREKETLDEATRELLGVAEEELRRVASISRTTLGFYRGQTTLSTVSAAKILDEVLEMYSRKLQESSIRVEKQYAPESFLLANEGELRQVFSNLISNAIDASREGGKIRLRVRPCRSWSKTNRAGLRISVADYGQGIAPENLQNVFEPFFTTKESVGTGLGLWVSSTIVQKHHGRIRVRSVPDRGTVFQVYLPGDHPKAADAMSA
jgi:PAS domain S-box-containing protein